MKLKMKEARSQVRSAETPVDPAIVGTWEGQPVTAVALVAPLGVAPNAWLGLGRSSVVRAVYCSEIVIQRIDRELK